MNLISDQVDQNEIAIILKYLRQTISDNILGDVVEFGCYLGTTSVFIADLLKETNKMFYVYDSFEGLPEKTNKDISPLGEAFKTGELNASKKQFIINMQKAGVKVPIIKKAWFSDLVDSDIPEKISFAFLDGDYYQSIKDSLKLIEHKMQKGSIIVVDDYSNSSLPGAAEAVDEWLSDKSYRIKTEKSLGIISIN